MTIKAENGKLDWKAIVSILSVCVMIITILVYIGGFQSKVSKIGEHDTAILESKSDRNLMHVEIATLKECARNTEAKLVSIENKLDAILVRQLMTKEKVK